MKNSKLLQKKNSEKHLMKPAMKELNEMLRSGAITKNDEATPWCSQAFPVQKPGSDPIKCRWVSDFCNPNKALKRPIWGSESSSQLLRRISPQARYFACFDAISGYHQIRVDTASQDLLNITTQMGNFKFTVLGQRICIRGLWNQHFVTNLSENP